jgi:NADPH2:quinone reductase
MFARRRQQKNRVFVNIVRSQAQANLLRQMGAGHVVDSTSPDFRPALIAALAETGATLAFDALGGGTMAATMEDFHEPSAGDSDALEVVAHPRRGSKPARKR